MARSIVPAVCAAFVLSACAQTGAPVTLKGDQFYGRSGSAPANKYYAAKQGNNQWDQGYVSGFDPSDRSVTYEAAAPAPVISVSDTTNAAAPLPSSVGVSEIAPISGVSISAAPPISITLPSRNATPFKTAAQSEAEYQSRSASMQSIKPLPDIAASTASHEDAAYKADARRFKNDVRIKSSSAPQQQAGNAEYIWPVEGKILSKFGPKKNGLYNDGINISAEEGEPIWAAAGGTVAYVGNALKGYGNMVLVRHPNSWISAYAHAKEIAVKKGDSVTQGQLLGYVGSSGSVDKPQLHFSLRDGKNPVDPQEYLARNVAIAQ